MGTGWRQHRRAHRTGRRAAERARASPVGARRRRACHAERPSAGTRRRKRSAARSAAAGTAPPARRGGRGRMIGALSRRERTIVIVGVLAIVIVAGWELVVQPLVERSRTAADMVPVREQALVRRRDLLAR